MREADRHNPTEHPVKDHGHLHWAQWTELPPGEHLVQVYHDEGRFVDLLHAYAAAGLRAGDSVVIIATPAHRGALQRRLLAEGHDLATARQADRYIDLDADKTLAEFMVHGWPDAASFERVILDLLARARRGDRPVRAFGEMVALMAARGQHAALLHLEQLWHNLCHSEKFHLLCAYPNTLLSDGNGGMFEAVCAAHTRTVPA